MARTTKTWAALAAFLLVPLGGALVASPASAVTGGIDGTVTGPGATPLAGVTVTAYTVVTEDPNDQTVRATTTTAGDGTYHLAVDSGTAIVCFSSPDYVRECWNGIYLTDQDFAHGSSAVTVDADGVQGIDASMITGSSVSGHLETDEGDPVVGAFVAAVQTGPDFFVAYDVTDAAGDYTIDRIAPGTFRICATGHTTMKQCTADVGLPATYTVDTDDVVTGVDFGFVARPHSMRVALTGADLIRWSWDAVPGATSYRIAVSTSPTMSHPVFRERASHWMTFEGLTKGKTYYAVVRAVSEGFGFDPAVTAPSAKVAARPGYVSSLRVASATGTSLTWTWSKYVVRDDTQQLASNYIVRLSSSPTMQGYRVLYAGSPGLTFDNLKPGKTYYAQIEALNLGKVLAPYGPIKTGKTLATP